MCDSCFFQTDAKSLKVANSSLVWQWDYKVPPDSMPLPIIYELLAFLDELANAAPVPVYTDDTTDPSCTIITDASAEGWAGCIIDHQNISFAQGRNYFHMGGQGVKISLHWPAERLR